MRSDRELRNDCAGEWVPTVTVRTDGGKKYTGFRCDVAQKRTKINLLFVFTYIYAILPAATWHPGKEWYRAEKERRGVHD